MPTVLSTCIEQEKRKVEPLGQERWTSLKTRRSETTLQCSERTPWLQTSPQFISLKPSFFVHQTRSWKLPHPSRRTAGGISTETCAGPLWSLIHRLWDRPSTRPLLPSSLCLNATHYIRKSFPDHSIYIGAITLTSALSLYPHF